MWLRPSGPPLPPTWPLSCPPVCSAAPRAASEERRGKGCPDPKRLRTKRGPSQWFLLHNKHRVPLSNGDAPPPPPLGMHSKGRGARGGWTGGWRRLSKRLGGGYCRLQMPLKPALGVRGTVAGHRVGALDGGRGYLPPSSNALLPPPFYGCWPFEHIPRDAPPPQVPVSLFKGSTHTSAELAFIRLCPHHSRGRHPPPPQRAPGQCTAAGDPVMKRTPPGTVHISLCT